MRLETQYPSDVGVLASFLFNYVKLNPGEALYLGANELHAYLKGECIECMATSDNVVRAGLTPKERDVQILCSMLTYKQVKMSSKHLENILFDWWTCILFMKLCLVAMFGISLQTPIQKFVWLTVLKLYFLEYFEKKTNL